MTQDDIDAQNAFSEWLFIAQKDSPAKTWWNLDVYHPAIGRALKIDRAQEGGVYALAPFRLWHDGERHLILAVHPAPRILEEVDDFTGIETVIAWNPLDDSAFVVGDPVPQLIGTFHDADEGAIYRSPLAFFQQWAIERAQYFTRWRDAQMKEWAHGTVERDLIPGKLAIGPLDKIRWTGLPQSIACHGLDAREVNRAILRQRNIPRAHSTQQRIAA